MRHDLEFALDRCLVELRRGTDIKRCLESYPEYARELQPLLQLAAAVGGAVPPASSHAAFATGRERMLAALTRKREQEAATPAIIRAIRHRFLRLVPEGPRGPSLSWSLTAVFLVIVLALGGGMAAAASASSLPGDLLYPLKLASQRAQIALTLDETEQQQVEARLWAQQRQDIQVVLKGNRQVEVAFHGLLESTKGNLWVVGGLPVTVLESTTISGQPWLGALVQVEANLPGNGDLLATRLLVEPATIEFPGPTPTATASSIPSKTPKPSDTAYPTETAGPTQPPTQTGTPEPENAIGPTETPQANRTQVREATPLPVDTSEPEDEQEPPDTPEPEHSPEAGHDPEPTDTSEPNHPPEPGHDPGPADTPEPEHSPEAGHDPEPTGTSEPEHPPESGHDPEPTDDPEPEDESNREEEPEPAGDPEREGNQGHGESGQDPSEDPGPREEPEGDEPGNPQGELGQGQLPTAKWPEGR